MLIIVYLLISVIAIIIGIKTIGVQNNIDRLFIGILSMVWPVVLILILIFCITKICEIFLDKLENRSK